MQSRRLMTQPTFFQVAQKLSQRVDIGSHRRIRDLSLDQFVELAGAPLQRSVGQFFDLKDSAESS